MQADGPGNEIDAVLAEAEAGRTQGFLGGGGAGGGEEGLMGMG